MGGYLGGRLIVGYHAILLLIVETVILRSKTYHAQGRIRRGHGNLGELLTGEDSLYSGDTTLDRNGEIGRIGRGRNNHRIALLYPLAETREHITVFSRCRQCHDIAHLESVACIGM